MDEPTTPSPDQRTTSPDQETASPTQQTASPAQPTPAPAAVAAEKKRYRFELNNTLYPYDDADAKVREFVLGFDYIGKKGKETVVYMQVILARGDSFLNERNPDAFDLQLGVREKLFDDPNMFTCIDYSVISSERFIPEEQRKNVLLLVLEAIRRLIDMHKPDLITMETYHRNVPESAMIKYRTAITVIEGRGYEQKHEELKDGKWYWAYARKAAAVATTGQILR